MSNLFAALLIAACIAGTYPPASASAGPETGKVGGSDRVEITDSIGRKESVPTIVKRIACLYAFSGHAVAMLGRCADIVAVVRGLKRDVLLNSICPGIERAAVPRFQNATNIEELILARPDIVFVPAEIGRNPSELEKFKKFNFPLVTVDFQTIEEQQDAISIIGKSLGEQRRAEQFREYYRKCSDLVGSRTSLIPLHERVRVYVSTLEPTRTASKGTLPSDWLLKAGAVNVALQNSSEIMAGKNYASIEEIMTWNPDVILTNEPSAREEILRNPQWSPLKAVRSHKVLQMPIGISRWGHPGSIETPLAILWAAKHLYPALFPDLDLGAEVRSFYKTFFNYPITDIIFESIMSGRSMREPKTMGN